MVLYPPRNTQPKPFYGLSLCSGFGGLELGLHTALPEYKTVCYVEREAFAAATLVARMEDQALDHAPVWSDVKSFDGRPWRGKVHILSAGYPCQPFSAAGRRKGRDDPRHLWPDVARIATECEPDWIFCENVEGHLDRGFEEVAEDLQAMGFEVKAGLFSAAETGASHLRRRLFILAHTNRHDKWKSSGVSFLSAKGTEDRPGRRPDRTTGRNHQCSTNLDGNVDLLQSIGPGPGQIQAHGLFAPPPCNLEAWEQILPRRMDLQPQFFGLADGLANRMERTRAAGNGVVSLAAAYAYVTLRSTFEEE